MSTKIITVSATPPSVSSGADYNKGAPLNAVEFDQNLVNLKAAVDGKMPLTGTASAVTFGAVTATSVNIPNGDTFYGTGLGTVTLGDNERLIGTKLEIRGALAVQVGSSVVTSDLTSVGCRVYTGVVDAIANIQVYNGNVTGYKNLALQDQGGVLLIGTPSSATGGVAKCEINGALYVEGGITASGGISASSFSNGSGALPIVDASITPTTLPFSFANHSITYHEASVTEWVAGHNYGLVVTTRMGSRILQQYYDNETTVNYMRKNNPDANTWAVWVAV